MISWFCSKIDVLYIINQIVFHYKKKSLVLECIYCLVKKIGLFKCSHISPFPIFLHTHLSIGPKNREALRQTELNVTYKVPFTSLGKTTRSPPIATSLSRCALLYFWSVATASVSVPLEGISYLPAPRSGDWEPQKALKLIQFPCSLCKQQRYSTALGKLALLKRRRPHPGLISEGTAAVPAKDDVQGWRGKTAGSSLGSLCFQHLGRVEAG